MEISITVLFYQGIYVIIALLGKKKKKNYNTEAKTLHKYAFIIAARNENAVIGNLIDSIKNQNYPSELIDVIVVADNCTDNRAVYKIASSGYSTACLNHHSWVVKIFSFSYKP